MLWLVALLSVVGCGDDSGANGRGPSSESGCARYGVYESDNWTMTKAYDVSDRYSSRADPGLDWYAQYERKTPLAGGVINAVSLRISGHNLGIDDLRSQLPGIDWREEGQPPGKLVGSAVGGPSSIVATSVSDEYALALLSYGLDIEELLRVTSETRLVCQQEWLGAGAKVLDCLPTEPGCGSDFQ